MSLSRKEIQRQRMYRYFLEAAAEIIEEEGIANLTVRNIAKKAGYTSSTVYNYFKDLSHLKFFAMIRYTKDYVEELPEYIEKGHSKIEKWLYTWECFCKHSFHNPEVYSILFMENLGTFPKDLLVKYYDIYQKDLVGLPEEVKPIIMEQSFSKRSTMFIQSAIDEGFIQPEDLSYISDVTLMIWKGMMSTYMNQRQQLTAEEALHKTMTLLYECVLQTIDPNKRHEINYSVPKMK